MDKKIILTIAAIIILGGAGAYLASSPESQLSMMEKDKMMDENIEDQAMKEAEKQVDNEAMMKTEENKMMDKDSTSMMTSGSYEAYSPEKLAKAADGNVVLFFRAGWCPTCRTLDADIKAHLSSIPKDLTILDVDYDNSTALKQKYGVTYQHTLVQVDQDGKLLKKWMGSPTLTAFVKEVI